MQVNYFGAVRITMALLPEMCRKGDGHVINISSIGTQVSLPRFSAYVASKSALEASMRSAAAEYFERGVRFTVVNFPLVRTPMIAPTKLYEHASVLTPEQAAGMIAEAIIDRTARQATGLGVFGNLVQTVSPRLLLLIMNVLYRSSRSRRQRGTARRRNSRRTRSLRICSRASTLSGRTRPGAIRAFLPSFVVYNGLRLVSFGKRAISKYIGNFYRFNPILS